MQLAVASFVFRPFDEHWLAITPDRLYTDDKNPLAAQVKMAQRSRSKTTMTA